MTGTPKGFHLLYIGPDGPNDWHADLMLFDDALGGYRYRTGFKAMSEAEVRAALVPTKFPILSRVAVEP